MHKHTLSLLRLTVTVFLIAGTVLLTINLIGLVDYTTITGNEDTVIADTPRKVSEAEFWEQAYLHPGEDVADYAVRLTALINDRMIAIDPAFAMPTFFENWILWL